MDDRRGRLGHDLTRRAVSVALVALAVAAAPAAAAPAPKRPTVYLLHGGAWRGWSFAERLDIRRRMAAAFTERGLRVKSLDYAPGRAGLTSVLAAVRADAPKRGGARYCFYGESAGGHLALLAARIRARTACVMSFGAPLRLSTWAGQCQRAAMPEAAKFADYIVETVFGTDEDTLTAWSPHDHAASIRANLLLIRQEDDVVVPPAQADAFRAVRPSTRLYEVQDDDARLPENQMVHGWVTPRERRLLRERLGAFARRSLRR